MNGEPVPIPDEHRITLTIKDSSIGGTFTLTDDGGLGLVYRASE
ncbi:hypothetical protein BH20CHL8_BH20CHL8_04520 [soil metagenome]